VEIMKCSFNSGYLV